MDVCLPPLYLAFLLCIAASSSDVGTDPHMHIEGYQDSGIKITCTAEKWNPAPELLWQDDGGKNLSAASEKIIPDENGLLKVETSFIASSNKKVSCVLRDRAQGQDREATLYIADTFFRRVSRCDISCPVIGISFALLWICLIVLVVYLFQQQKVVIGDLQIKIGNLNDELEWSRNRIYEDHVTLDGKTAPNLSVTDDCKSVSPRETSSSQNAERFNRTNTVLAREEFTEGKHYWEVDVRDKTGWMLGVLEEGKSGHTRHWGLSLYKNKYKSNTEEKRTELRVDVLTKVGVFVNCTDHTVSFYSVDRKSKLCSFTEQFTSIKPFLDPGYCEPQNSGALTICPVLEWD